MAAALPFSAIEAKLSSLKQDDPQSLSTSLQENDLRELHWLKQRDSHNRHSLNHQPKEILEITGVFRGRELTRKERRLTSGITPIDNLIGGGIVRGRISEIVGNASAGKTSLAAAFAASMTSRGEVAAWIDADGSFDPASAAVAGIDLARMLWVALPIKSNRRGFQPMDEFEHDRPGPSRTAAEFAGDRLRPPQMAEEFERDEPGLSRSEYRSNYALKRSASTIVLKAAEWILTAGGFGLVVIDCGGAFSGRSTFTQSAALRLARGAERSGAAVIVIGPYRMCGTFAALSLMLSRARACFSRASRQAPMLFDGLTIAAQVMRNKLGGAGGAATWHAFAEPSCRSLPESVPLPALKSTPAMPICTPTVGSADSLHSPDSPETTQNIRPRTAAR